MIVPTLIFTNMFVTITFMTTELVLPAPGSASESVSGRVLWLTLIVVLIADALDLIDATIATVAAPSIVRDLGGGEALVK